MNLNHKMKNKDAFSYGLPSLEVTSYATSYKQSYSANIFKGDTVFAVAFGQDFDEAGMNAGMIVEALTHAATISLDREIRISKPYTPENTPSPHLRFRVDIRRGDELIEVVYSVSPESATAQAKKAVKLIFGEEL